MGMFIICQITQIWTIEMRCGALYAQKEHLLSGTRQQSLGVYITYTHYVIYTLEKRACVNFYFGECIG